MKSILLTFLLTLILGATIQSQQGNRTITTERVTLKNTRLTAPRLVEILNHGIVQELNKLTGGERQELTLRLWQIPKEGDCMPDTHYVCSYHYYLAAAPHEEGFEGAVYDLGELGEISDIQWQQSDVSDTVQLSMRVTNYPREYLRDNKKLVIREKRYLLFVTTEKLTIKSLK